jgi:hypothetical protein
LSPAGFGAQFARTPSPTPDTDTTNGAAGTAAALAFAAARVAVSGGDGDMAAPTAGEDMAAAAGEGVAAAAAAGDSDPAATSPAPSKPAASPAAHLCAALSARPRIDSPQVRQTLANTLSLSHRPVKHSRGLRHLRPRCACASPRLWSDRNAQPGRNGLGWPV